MTIVFRQSYSIRSVHLLRGQITIVIRIIAGGIAIQATEEKVLYCSIRQEPSELEKGEVMNVLGI